MNLYVDRANPEHFRVAGNDRDGIRLTIDLAPHGRVDIHASGWEEIRRFVNHLEDAVAAADGWCHNTRPGMPLLVVPLDEPAYEVAAS